MERILVTEPISPAAVTFLRTRHEVVQGTGGTREQVLREGADCAAILLRSAHITAEMMDTLPKLRVIAKHGIGLDNIDVEGATARGIAVVNTPFANVNAVAEHTVALLLALAKHIVVLDAATRSGGFGRRNSYVNLELAGKTAGLVGLGRIARQVSRKLAAFDMHLVGYDPAVTAEEAAALGITLLPLEEVLRCSDFVSLHVPLLPATHHLIGPDALAMMKPTACLLNAARGAVVDEGALYAALRAGTIAGAGLDVFEEEPPRADSPLFALENIVLSPHNAALSDAALEAMAMDSAHGIADHLAGVRPEFLCNPSILDQ